MRVVQRQPHGYTIAEVLIYLAVTGLLFIIAVYFVTGQQRKTEFTQGVRDFESAILDYANNVSTGYYANGQTISCSGDTTQGNDVTLAISPSDTRGSNSDSIYLGTVVHFAPGGDKARYNAYPVAGKQRINDPALGTREVATLAEARPMAITRGSSVNSGAGAPDAMTTNTLSGGVTIERVVYGSSPGTDANAAGFFDSLGVTNQTGLQPGRVTVGLYPIADNTNTSLTMADAIHNNVAVWAANKNPAAGIRVCLQSGGTDEYAVLTIGGNYRQLTTNVSYFTGNCSGATL